MAVHSMVSRGRLFYIGLVRTITLAEKTSRQATKSGDPNIIRSDEFGCFN